jgi:hypothetical protein
MKAPVLLLLAVCTLSAASSEVDALIAAARDLPAEFAADSLLRLAALDQVEAPRKIELIRQAFDKASQAQQPFKLRSVFNPGQSILPFLNRANQQELDALSLELRAVDAMLAADPAQARALFLRIPAVHVAALHCADVMAADMDHFYQTLAGVAGRSFRAEEKTSGEAARFLARYAGAFASPVEARPAADAIAGWDGSDADFGTLVTAYAGALGKIHGDDRSFTYAQRLGSRIEKLAAECKRRQVSPLPLLEAYRLYLVVHLSAARCADDDRVSAGGVSFGLATQQQPGPSDNSVVEFFNQKLRMDPLQPIQELESTPARLEGEVVVTPACQDAACRAIVERYRGLVFGPNGQPIRAADQAGAEWPGKLQALLSELKKWTAGKESRAEFFRDKAAMYIDVLKLAQERGPREAVVHSELEFLAQSREQANRSEWFVMLSTLLARTVLDPADFGPFGAEMRQSSDPVVALYARLEAVAPRPIDRLVGLL